MEEVETTISRVDMIIVKASREKADGTMRLRMVNSDTGEDVFGEKMSIELFEDFIQRSNENLPVPEPFDTVIHEEKWQGGKPYLSIAHYKSDAFDELPGEQEKLYLDGEKLKSVDVLYDNELGNRIWKSVYNDLYEEEKDYENPVRVSIGFVDLAHKHEIENKEDFIFTRTSLEDKCELCEKGVGNKTYLKGHLVHKAFTRVPAHPRTDVEIEMKSSKIMTKKDDAESIIGSDIELEQKSQVVEDLLVVKADDDSRDSQNLEEVMEETKQEQEEVEVVASPDVEEVVEELQEDNAVEPEVVEPKSDVIQLAESMETKLAELAEKGIFGEEALKEVQPMFNQLGDVVKSKVTPQGELANVAGVIKSTIQEIIPDLKREIVSQLVKELSGITSKPAAPALENDNPIPRSLVTQRSNLTPQGKDERTQIEKLAGL